VRGHVEVKNAATIMSQYQKHVEDLETDCEHVKNSLERAPG